MGKAIDYKAMTVQEVVSTVSKAIRPLSVSESIAFVEEVIEQLEMTLNALEYDKKKEREHDDGD